jgi:hypothetical protein
MAAAIGATLRCPNEEPAMLRPVAVSLLSFAIASTCHGGDATSIFTRAKAASGGAVPRAIQCNGIAIAIAGCVWTSYLLM